MRGISKGLLTLGASAAIVAGLAGTALADPPSGTTPAATDIVGVGSDTTQLVVDQLSTDYNKQSPAPTNKLYSFDAVGSSTIVTKTGCAAITRPNGSGAGIAALKANTKDGSGFCVDFARSSRGPAAGDGSGGALDFVAFAKDGVTWSATNTSAKPTHAPSTLSIKQLQAIYACDASGIGGTGRVTWNEVGGTGTNAVVPVIPQSASGTRAFFLNAIGIGTASGQKALGSCVVPTDNSVEENEGTNTIFAGSNSQDLVFPYSVAVYLAQSQNGHGTGTQGNQVLRSVTNSSGTAVSPTTGTSPNLALNPALATVGLARNVYNVVRDASGVPSYLQAIFGSGTNSGYICTNSTAQADIKSYGFASLGSQCGSITKVAAGS